MPEDVFLTSPRKPSNRRSTASLRALSSDSTFADGGGGFSLAHELAVAMMPEPSAGSKLLAEEFGIEFNEGAEGLDGPGPQIHVLAADLASTDNFISHLPRLDADASLPPSISSTSSFSAFPASPSLSSTAFREPSTALNGSDNSSKLQSGQPALERLASDVIRRNNNTARDRKTQLRELLQYEREFRRIEAEVGGQDVLGRLDELDFPVDDEPEPEVLLALTSELDAETETDPDCDQLGDVQQEEEGEEPEIDPAFANHDNATLAASPTLQTSFASLSSSHQRVKLRTRARLSMKVENECQVEHSEHTVPDAGLRLWMVYDAVEVRSRGCNSRLRTTTVKFRTSHVTL
ncbi:hypothetical protein C8R45DRAFT_932818 [Mycena sanguinolenta]|nr:hypothetical protein C8R45DRAFT_932818 [Mycena sanguinolenta]